MTIFFLFQLAVARLFPKGGGADECKSSMMSVWVPAPAIRHGSSEITGRSSVTLEHRISSPGSDVSINSSVVPL